MIPTSRYKFVITKNKVIAISSYAGKTVKGVAKVHPNDLFDEEYGKNLARARCDLKIAKKRAARADKKLTEAFKGLSKAYACVRDTREYYENANSELVNVNEYLKNILENA